MSAVEIVRQSTNTVRRTYWKVVGIESYVPNTYGLVKRDKRVQCPEPQAQLVSSLTTNGLHAPTLDIDFEAELLPSTTPGHFHLFLNTEITWRHYRKLLKVLKKAGIISKAYYRLCLRHKQSMVRKPGYTKSIYEDLQRGS